MGLRLPSLQSIIDDILRISRRFPQAVAIALVAAVSAQFLVGGSYGRDEFRLLLALLVGLPISICLPLLRERGQRPPASIALHVLLAAFLAWFYFAWPRWTDEQSIRHLLQLKLCALLLVAGLPYWNRREIRGFWQFNRAMLLRFLQTTVFAAILFAGLSALLAALDQLFGIDVDEDAYIRLWLFLVTIFHPLYFLGGVPRRLDDLEYLEDYVPALRILGQFILMPLVAAYLLLLLAYFVKIVITTEWPSGSIGWLVSAAAVVGTFSLLLLHPLAERAGGDWIARYRRAFYAGMISALCMLLVAIAKRIGQYGWSENRYFLGILAVWLLALCLAYFLARWRDIRWIPLSLAAVALLSGFGPWGAYSVARKSQLARLETILDGAGLLRGGLAIPSGGAVQFEARRELSAVTSYLVANHGLDTLEPIFAERWAEIMADSTLTEARSQARVGAQAVLASIDVDFVDRWEVQDDEFFYFQRQQEETPVEITEFDLVWSLSFYNDEEKLLRRGDSVWSLRLLDRRTLRLSNAEGAVSMAPLDSILVLAHDARGSTTQRAMRVDVQTPEMQWMLELMSLNGRKKDDAYEVQNMQCRLYLKDSSARN